MGAGVAARSGLSMTDLSSIPRLRYRRLGGGYRRAEVLYHLRELEARVRTLEAELAAARESRRALAAELDEARTAVAAFRAREAEVETLRAAAEQHAGDIVAAAEARARAVLAEADEQAARIRGEAHLKIDDIGKQLEEILRLRESMLAALRGVVQDVGLAVGRIERGEPVYGPAPAGRRRDALRPVGAGAAVQRHEPLPGDEIVLGREVVLDAGPFADFATLASFERALGSLPNVEDVYVRRFAGERATIEVTMTVEQPLLALLRGALPYAFEATAEDGGVRVDVPATSLAGTG